MDVKELLITEKHTLIEAMEQLDSTAKKVLFVHEDEKLLAAVTDGDIRRWILKKGNLDALVKDIANYDPLYLEESRRKEAKRIMMDNYIEALPILSENKRIHSIALLNESDILAHSDYDIPVVIMAGGLGSRLYPYTKILPKPLIPIGESPILEHIMDKFYLCGSSNFNLIVNYKKNMIKAYFSEAQKDYSISYFDEDKPLGTGGGLSLLKEVINETFILSNCDILIDSDYNRIYEYHRKCDNVITIVASMKTIKIPYGVIELNKDGDIANMHEKPESVHFVNTGMYIVEPEVINSLECNKSIGFPDIIKKYRDQGHKIGVYPIEEDCWMDMGQFSELEKMRNKLNHEDI